MTFYATAWAPKERTPTQGFVDETGGHMRALYGIEGVELRPTGLPHTEWSTGVVEDPEEGSEEYEGRGELVGHEDCGAVVDEAFAKWGAEAEGMLAHGDRPQLLVYSDAGYHAKGDESTGGYGWVITGLERVEGAAPTREYSLKGGGLVHGPQNVLSSTR